MCRTGGISLLLTISLLESPTLILPLYLLHRRAPTPSRRRGRRRGRRPLTRFSRARRGGRWLVNCTAGLTKSVLNDYVSKKHRAKWAALDSINTSSWAGSAMLGGFLADRLGYRKVFLITAGLGLLANSLYLPLAWLVAVETKEGKPGGTTAPAAGSSNTTRTRSARSGGMAAPLLESFWFLRRPHIRLAASSTHLGR